MRLCSLAAEEAGDAPHESVGCQFLGLRVATDDAAIAELAPRVKAMGFDVLELGIEAPGQWDPRRTGAVLAEHGLGAAVCAAMGAGPRLHRP